MRRLVGAALFWRRWPPARASSSPPRRDRHLQLDRQPAVRRLRRRRLRDHRASSSSRRAPPVSDGTIVLFFTDLGTIDREGKTKDGLAHVNFDVRQPVGRRHHPRSLGRSGPVGGAPPRAPTPSASRRAGPRAGGGGTRFRHGPRRRSATCACRTVRLRADPPRITNSNSTHVFARVHRRERQRRCQRARVSSTSSPDPATEFFDIRARCSRTTTARPRTCCGPAVRRRAPRRSGRRAVGTGGFGRRPTPLSIPILMKRPVLLRRRLVLGAEAASARADIALLSSGTTLKVTAQRREGDTVFLTLKDGGEVGVAATELRGVVPDEVLDEVVPAAPRRARRTSPRWPSRPRRRHGLDPGSRAGGGGGGVGVPPRRRLAQGRAGPDAAHARDRALRWASRTPSTPRTTSTAARAICATLVDALQRRRQAGPRRLQRGRGRGGAPRRRAALSGDARLRAQGPAARVKRTRPPRR